MEGGGEKGRKERTYIRITPHKCKTIHALRPLVRSPITNPRGRRHDSVCHQQPGIVQQDHRSGEMAAYFYCFRPSLLSLSARDIQLPTLPINEPPHRLLRARFFFNEPLLIIASEINRAFKHCSPEQMSTVEMGVRNHDSDQTAQLAYGADEGGRKEGNAVPEDVAGGCVDEEGALTNGEAGGAVDNGERRGGGMGGEETGVVETKRTEGGEGLTCWGDVLAGCEGVSSCQKKRKKC